MDSGDGEINQKSTKVKSPWVEPSTQHNKLLRFFFKWLSALDAQCSENSSESFDSILDEYRDISDLRNLVS